MLPVKNLSATLHAGRWRLRVVVATCVLLAVGCGQDRDARAPEPVFVEGEIAVPSSVAGQGQEPPSDEGEGQEILPSQVEPDSTEVLDVSQMVRRDDSGQVLPNTEGWEAFDLALQRRLIPANQAAGVAVMLDGRVVHAAGFGQRVAGNGEAVDAADRFRIGSVSKTVSAIVMLRLVERGTVGLDEPVGERLASHLGVPNPAAAVQALTPRTLMSHTSGMPKHDAKFFANGATSCVDAAATSISHGVGGKGFRYSNMNYCVLGVLIEVLTGKSYEQVVNEELLAPLGIRGMRIPSTYDLSPDEVSHYPYPGRNYMEVLQAAGAWNATPSDLTLIMNAIDPTTPGWKALSPEMSKQLRYRGAPSGTPSGYGLGVINYESGFGHTGTIEHTHTMVMVQPNGITWAIAVSGDSPSDTRALRFIVRKALRDAFG